MTTAVLTDETKRDEAKGSALPGHYNALVGVLKRPREFFGGFPARPGLRRPLQFLCISAVFYTGVSVVYFLGGSVGLALAVLINALATPLILAAITWMLLTMTTERFDFKRILAMYAYASGALMLFSWIPMVGYVCELWKAGLMACALACGLGLGWKRAVAMVVATFFLVMLLLWSLMPVLGEIKTLFA